MRNALLFRDAAEFTQFVLATADVASTGSPHGFELLQIRLPSERTPRLLLLGFRRPRKQWQELLRRTGPADLKAEVQGGRGRLQRTRQDSQSFEVERGWTAPRLIDLLRLEPRAEQDEDRRRVVLWFAQDEAAGRFVADSLRLENDRIQFATLGPEGDLLLRVEQPSYYLLQRCLESGEARVFVSVTDSLHVAWGSRHPLQELWLRSDDGAARWRFFDADSRLHEVAPLRWKPLYDAVELEPLFTTDRPPLSASEEPPRFRVAVRLTPRAEPLDAHLWLVPDDDFPRLEQILTTIRREDLERFLVAALEDQDGRRWHVVQEKAGAQGERHVEMPGRGFARLPGLSQLLLPVDREVRPRLRRDQYARLFPITQRTLTLVVPLDDSATPRVGCWELGVGVFKPLPSLIDYVLETDRQRLETIRREAVLDFGHYARAPRRPDLLTAEEKKAKTAASAEEPASTGGTDDARRDVVVETRLEATGEQAEEHVPRSERERLEAELESTLVTTADDEPGPWRRLAQLKAAAGKTADQLDLSVEAAWLDPTPPAWQALWGVVVGRLEPRTWSVKAVEPHAREGNALALLALAWGHGSLEIDSDDHWLRATRDCLRLQESRLRIKERWLAWSAVWRLSPDERETARVREEILEQLNAHGLQPEEMPECLRQRLFMQRELGGAGADDSRREERGAARRNAESLAQHGGELPPPLRAAGQAMIARALSRSGQPQAAQRLLRQAESGARRDQAQAALVRLYAAHAAHAADAAGREAQRVREEAEHEIQQLDREQRRAVAKVADSLAERVEVDDPARFLSAENFRRFFPWLESYRDDPVYRSTMQFRQRYRDGDLKGAAQALTDGLKAATEQLGGAADLRVLARMVEMLADGIEQVRSKDVSGGLLGQFNQFVTAWNRHALTHGDDFFYVLANAAIARAQLLSGQESAAVARLRATAERMQRLPMLDYIDAGASICTTAEQLPLRERGPVLTTVMRGLRHVAGAFFSPHQAAFGWQLLDQLAEAAVSKDRLTIETFRHYLDRDEHRIRRRILRDFH